MTTIALPSNPRARNLTVHYMDATAILRGSHGGATQHVDRLGTRHSIDVVLPTMRIEARPDEVVEFERQARIWINRLKLAKKNKSCIWEFLQPGFKVGQPGAPVIKANTLSNASVIPLSGLTPNYDFQEGQWLSVLSGGRYYLHSVDQQVIANQAGEAQLPVTPMIRTDFSQGDTVQVGMPIIQGFLTGDEFSWTIDEAKMVGLSFSIEEEE